MEYWGWKKAACRRCRFSLPVFYGQCFLDVASRWVGFQPLRSQWESQILRKKRCSSPRRHTQIKALIRVTHPGEALGKPWMANETLRVTRCGASGSWFEVARSTFQNLGSHRSTWRRDLSLFRELKGDDGSKGRRWASKRNDWLISVIDGYWWLLDVIWWYCCYLWSLWSKPWMVLYCIWYLNGKGWISIASIWDPRWASYPVTLRLHRRRKVRRRNAGLELNQTTSNMSNMSNPPKQKHNWMVSYCVIPELTNFFWSPLRVFVPCLV